MARPKTLTGPLYDPIEVHGPTDYLEHPRILEMMWQQYAQKAKEKLPLLLEAYGKSGRNKYLELALTLALHYEPGFAPKIIHHRMKHGNYGAVVRVDVPKDGRPSKWTDEKLLRLLDEIEKMKPEGFTNREIFKRLALKVGSEWRRPRDHKGELANWVETLEARYHDAVKRRTRLQADGKRQKELVDRLMDLCESFPQDEPE